MDFNVLMYYLKPYSSAPDVAATIGTVLGTADADRCNEIVKEMISKKLLIPSVAPKSITDKDGNTTEEPRTFLTPAWRQGQQRALTDRSVLEQRAESAVDLPGIPEYIRNLMDRHQMDVQWEFEPEMLAALRNLAPEAKQAAVEDGVVDDSLKLSLLDQRTYGYDSWLIGMRLQQLIPRMHPTNRGACNLNAGQPLRAMHASVEQHVVGGPAVEYILHGYGEEYGLTGNLANAIRTGGSEFLRTWRDSDRWGINVPAAKKVLPIFGAAVLVDRILHGEATGQLALDISDSSTAGAQGMGAAYGCPQMQLLSNTTSHPVKQDWYSALINAMALIDFQSSYNNDVVKMLWRELNELFFTRGGDFGAKSHGTPIQYGSESAGIQRAHMLTKTAAKKRFDLFDSFDGSLLPNILNKLHHGRGGIANPKAEIFTRQIEMPDGRGGTEMRSIGMQLGANILKHVATEYVNAAMRVSPILQQANQMQVDMVETAMARDETMKVVSRMGSVMTCFVAGPLMGEESKVYRKKFNGREYKWSCKPFYNAFRASMKAPLEIQFYTDVDDVHYCMYRAMQAGTKVASVFDAVCPINLNYITDCVQWRRQSLIDMASHAWGSFNHQVNYWGVEERRKGHTPLCPKSAAQATYFVGHGGA